MSEIRSIIWVHQDALSRAHPVFAAAPSGSRTLFVWDAKDLARRNWSLKRCVFLMECLKDMNVEIVSGDPVELLNSLGASHIYTARTPDPYLKSVMKRLDAKVSIIDAPNFVSVPDQTDMGRFFRFWNKVRGSALRPTEEGHSA